MRYDARPGMPLLRPLAALTALKSPATRTETFSWTSRRLVASRESTLAVALAPWAQRRLQANFRLPYGLLPQTATSVTTAVPSAPGVQATSFGIRFGWVIRPLVQLVCSSRPLRLRSHAATLVDA